MSYVDAGYAIALSVLFVYSAGLVARRRRLARAVSVAAEDDLPGPATFVRAEGESAGERAARRSDR
ncbi:MAG: hypothetical protein ACYCU7_06540 [Acidimicrobiales bacterium]